MAKTHPVTIEPFDVDDAQAEAYLNAIGDVVAERMIRESYGDADSIALRTAEEGD